MPIQLKSKQKDAAASDEAKRPAAAPRAGKKAKAAHGRIPNKQNINLAMVGVKRTNWTGLIIALVLIFAAVLAAGKFLILDRLNAVNAAKAEADNVRQEINLYNAKIASYGELTDIYAHYTFTGMTDEENTRVERTEVMSLLQRTVILRTDVSYWELKGNLLTVNVQGNTLQDINLTAEKLRNDPLVNYCQVNTAETRVKATSTKEGEEPERVAATIEAYLNKPEEVAEK